MYSKDDSKATRLEFWKKLESRTRRLPSQKGREKKWILDNTGIKGLDLRFDVNREYAMVALEINHSSEDRRLKLFWKLEACKSLFETAFGMPLKWNLTFMKDDKNHACRVYTSMPADIYNQECWPDVMYFLIDRMIRMETAFLEVKDFLKYDELGDN